MDNNPERICRVVQTFTAYEFDAAAAIFRSNPNAANYAALEQTMRWHQAAIACSTLQRQHALAEAVDGRPMHEWPETVMRVADRLDVKEQP